MEICDVGGVEAQIEVEVLSLLFILYSIHFI
jgi:hypothetical protein